MDESREGESKWSEILQRVISPQVEEEVSRFKICEDLPGLHRFQPSLGVVVCLVDEMVVREIPVASGY